MAFEGVCLIENSKCSIDNEKENGWEVTLICEMVEV